MKALCSPLELSSTGASEGALHRAGRWVSWEEQKDCPLTQGCFTIVPLIHLSFTQLTCLPTLGITNLNFCQSKGEESIAS